MPVPGIGTVFKSLFVIKKQFELRFIHPNLRLFPPTQSARRRHKVTRKVMHGLPWPFFNKAALAVPIQMS
jgi:hypothetical protein